MSSKNDKQALNNDYVPDITVRLLYVTDDVTEVGTDVFSLDG